MNRDTSVPNKKVALSRFTPRQGLFLCLDSYYVSHICPTLVLVSVVVSNLSLTKDFAGKVPPSADCHGTLGKWADHTVRKTIRQINLLVWGWCKWDKLSLRS